VPAKGLESAATPYPFSETSWLRARLVFLKRRGYPVTRGHYAVWIALYERRSTQEQDAKVRPAAPPDTATCWDSQEQIGERTGYSRKRVGELVRDLEAWGELARTVPTYRDRATRGERNATVYTLHRMAGPEDARRPLPPFQPIERKKKAPSARQAELRAKLPAGWEQLSLAGELELVTWSVLPDEWVDVPQWALAPLPRPAPPVSLVPPASAWAEHGPSMAPARPCEPTQNPVEQGTTVPTKEAPKETPEGFIFGAVTSPRARAVLSETERALLNRTMGVALCYLEKHSNQRISSYLEHVRIVEQVKEQATKRLTEQLSLFPRETHLGGRANPGPNPEAPDSNPGTPEPRQRE